MYSSTRSVEHDVKSNGLCILLSTFLLIHTFVIQALLKEMTVKDFLEIELEEEREMNPEKYGSRKFEKVKKY